MHSGEMRNILLVAISVAESEQLDGTAQAFREMLSKAEGSIGTACLRDKTKSNNQPSLSFVDPPS